MTTSKTRAAMRIGLQGHQPLGGPYSNSPGTTRQPRWRRSSSTRTVDAGRHAAKPIDPRRSAAERHGRIAEAVAAILLMLRGYRILARRLVTAAGEVDIVAVRGSRLAFIEVKQRASWAEAETAVRRRQTERLHRAAAQFVAARPFYRDHVRAFDAVLVVPGALPRHCPDALKPEVASRVWTWG